MRVDSWFPAFFAEFSDSHAYYPWPEAGTEELARIKQDWKDTFILRGITKEVAEATRLRLLAEDLKPFGNVLARFLAEAKEVQRERAAAQNPDAEVSDRDAAAIASAHCRDCGGNGLTTRYRHHAVGDGIGRNAAGFAIVFTCACPLGRWIAKTNAGGKDKHLARSLPDLTKHPAYQLHPADWTTPKGELDNAHRYPPTAWNPIDQRPTVEAVNFDGSWKRRYDAQAQAARGVRPAFAPKPAAPLPPPAEPIRPVLTHSQSTLLAALGPHWSQEFKGLAPHVQREILASARDSYDNDTLTAAVDRIRDESETVLF